MASTTDIAVWGRSVPEWMIRALQVSGRMVSDIGGGPLTPPTSFPNARVHEDIRTFASRTRGTPLLCADLLTSSDAIMLAEGRSLVFSVEPLPAAACGGLRPPRVCLLPGLPHDSMMSQAGDAAADGARCHHLLIEAGAPPAYGSILARLADAARSIVMWMGMPDGVTCSLSGARPNRVREDLPDAASRALAEFRGTASCLMRYADSRGAAIVASASAPVWERRVHLQMDDGAIVADDTMMVRLGVSGEELESASIPPDDFGVPDSIAAECLASDAELERTKPESLAQRTAALVEAICLSGITGEWEEPARIEDILARSNRFADD
jgi:hypothetical protein